MRQLTDIAKDYAVVKNYVYRRYSGIRSVSKLNSKYEIQNEMTASGLRQELGLPSVYFYPAISDALADIKAGWKHVRRSIVNRAMSNENFSENEKYYVCRAVRMDSLFAGILEGKVQDASEILHDDIQRQPALNNYIRRQVRRLKPNYSSKKASYFRVTVKGYLYRQGTIRLTTKISRKRIPVLLTDKNEYHHQLEVSLIPKELKLVINVPVETKVRHHVDYTEVIGVAMGYEIMFTVSNGHCYGQEYGARRTAQLQKLIQMDANYRSMEARRRKCLDKGDLLKAENIEKNNLGRKKYDSYNRRSNTELKAYINAEIERLLRQEKPSVIYIAKLPKNSPMGKQWSKDVRKKFIYWQRGFIRERLDYKCMANGVKLVYVFAKDISNRCGNCQSRGIREGGRFRCKACGRDVPVGENTAINILNTGQNTEGNG